jgi:hypothetical protein
LIAPFTVVVVTSGVDAVVVVETTGLSVEVVVSPLTVVEVV